MIQAKAFAAYAEIQKGVKVQRFRGLKVQDYHLIRVIHYPGYRTGGFELVRPPKAEIFISIEYSIASNRQNEG